MKTALKESMEEFCKTYFVKNKKITLSPAGVFNKFNHIRIDHKGKLEELRKEIRNYLYIDEKWL